MSVAGWVHGHRGALLSPPLIFSLVWFRGEIEAPWLTWPLGLGLVVVGVALRIWAQEHLHHRLKLPVQFTTTGPYQWVRNPLYIGNILIYLGATVLSKLLWLVPVTVFWCAAIYSVVVRYEEADLLRQHGEAYRRYQSEVPRWIPRFRRFAHPVFMNQYFRAAVASEAHCFLIIVPFILKQMVSPFFKH